MAHKESYLSDTMIDWLLGNIERFLDANPGISDEGFGWFACKDSSVLGRLRLGGDIRTKKVERILAFLKFPVDHEGNPAPEFTPTTLTRRVYD